ncbi:hypothetical protein HID58_022579 [Brassica napus]|uniref:Uncharacterized protein n=1 Tax=Brassica napus TaxID=3708 RepID=A0ABQ8CZN4_BRANA|nr:hypothetical protein HID58_022579 [Brassica napus]
MLLAIVSLRCFPETSALHIFLEFNIHRNQKLRSASAREVAATAVLPPSFVGEVLAMCCFKLPDACGASPRFHDLDKFSGLPLNDCRYLYIKVSIGKYETLELKNSGSDYLGKAGFFPHIQVFFLLFSTGSDPTQQTAIDNFMVHELVKPKMSGAGAIKSLLICL